MVLLQLQQWIEAQFNWIFIMENIGSDERASQTSSKATHSTSSATSEVTRARALAEAARVRASFAEREAQIKIESAEREAKIKLERVKLDAELELLSMKREAAAASAQADALAAEEFRTRVPYNDVAERTAQYLKQQADLHASYSSMPSLELANGNMLSPGPDHTLITHQTPPDGEPNANSTMVQTSNPTPLSPLPEPMQKCTPDNGALKSPTIEHSFDAKLQNASKENPSQGPAINDFAKFLARRELVNTGLTHFDDRPESFRAWQSSFNNATKGLGLTASEELDLLVKWLGKEFSLHVKRIRAVHINDPSSALKKVWERLRECYAASEVIESSLFKKLDGFPTISSRDYLKLREHGDLLMEVQSAKEDDYFPGLTYLDTARGVNPIIEKLPHSLQERWITKGSRFKKKITSVSLRSPSLWNLSALRPKPGTTPSFAFSSSSSGPMRSERFTPKGTSTRAPITVHKTDVSTAAHQNADHVCPEGRWTPTKPAPSIIKPHPLRKCRGFKN